MSPHQHGRKDRDGDRDTRDVLQGLAAALPPSLLLCGVVALALLMLR
jgi:hypothetical protein